MPSSGGYERRFYDLDDGQISAIHCGDLSQPVKLVFLHANGFNGLTYRHLLNQLPVHSVSLDLRGHGFSKLPITPQAVTSFKIFADDVTAFLDRHIDGPVMIAGHSLGGAVALLAHQARPDLINAALILDPPTLPASWRFLFRNPLVNRWLMKNFNYAKKARARNAIFPDREFLYSHYKKKTVFKNFVPEILRDYIEGGTRPHEKGIELCCDPAWEARIFLAQDNDVFGAAKALPAHSFYILAGDYFASGPSARLHIRRIMGKQRMETAKDMRHLFPMEAPDYVADKIKTLLRASGAN